jgi:hypothetical protein
VAAASRVQLTEAGRALHQGIVKLREQLMQKNRQA